MLASAYSLLKLSDNRGSHAIWCCSTCCNGLPTVSSALDAKAMECTLIADCALPYHDSGCILVLQHPRKPLGTAEMRHKQLCSDALHCLYMLLQASTRFVRAQSGSAPALQRGPDCDLPNLHMRRPGGRCHNPAVSFTTVLHVHRSWACTTAHRSTVAQQQQHLVTAYITLSATSAPLRGTMPW